MIPVDNEQYENYYCVAMGTELKYDKFCAVDYTI